MKQFLLNLWNAQANARRVKVLEIQVEILSYPHKEQDDVVYAVAINCRTGERTPVRLGSQFFPRKADL